MLQRRMSATYLDRGFDLSEPDASFPLLLHDGINDEVFSVPNDGLGTRFLPAKDNNYYLINIDGMTTKFLIN